MPKFFVYTETRSGGDDTHQIEARKYDFQGDYVVFHGDKGAEVPVFSIKSAIVTHIRTEPDAT